MTPQDRDNGFSLSIIGGLYGAGLLVLAALLTGGGHGTYLPLLIFGAPLTFVGGWLSFLSIIVLWATIGFVLGAYRRPIAPSIVLLLHLVSVGVILARGSGFESAEEQWEHLARVQVYAGESVKTAFGVYASGQIAAWGFLVVRALLQRRRSTTA